MVFPNCFLDAPKFQCEQCDKTYKTKEQFKRHKVVHSGKRPYNCKICNKSFMRQDDVQRHVKTVHKNKADQEMKCVSITSQTPESPTVKVRMACGETLEMEADLDASVHLVAVNQLQRQGSALEFGEVPKFSNEIGTQATSAAVNVDPSLTCDQKEYLEAIFNVNDSVATSECRLITVSIRTCENVLVAEQVYSEDPYPSDSLQIIYQQIMDELTEAGSKTVKDNRS
ncbi:unnamed protein product [Orchesella dallaii]|uniref:C2H2-type domain-containing protein n=1 Tax=Orchesella dallaii TaxID=48710 RepID=A0ABP1S1R4_9HEXA